MSPAGRVAGGGDPSDIGGMSKASTCRVRKPVFAVCSAMSAATSMPAPASNTNEKAICVVANTRSRRLVPGVIRRLLLARPEPRRRVRRRQSRNVGEKNGSSHREARADPQRECRRR